MLFVEGDGPRIPFPYPEPYQTGLDLFSDGDRTFQQDLSHPLSLELLQHIDPLDLRGIIPHRLGLCRPRIPLQVADHPSLQLREMEL
jgi:hypothetical protein